MPRPYRKWMVGVKQSMAFVMVAAMACTVWAAEVRTMRVPEGGIQPQAEMDVKGTIHLVYFKGDPAGGDLFYVRGAAGQSGFSAPVRVNSVNS